MIVSGRAVGEWVSAKLGTPCNFEGCEAIGLRLGERIVAGVIYENWNGASCVCHIAIDGPLTPAYMAAIFHYPFTYGGLRKIIATGGKSYEAFTKIIDYILNPPAPEPQS